MTGGRSWGSADEVFWKDVVLAADERRATGNDRGAVCRLFSELHGVSNERRSTVSILLGTMEKRKQIEISWLPTADQHGPECCRWLPERWHLVRPHHWRKGSRHFQSEAGLDLRKNRLNPVDPLRGSGLA